MKKTEIEVRSIPFAKGIERQKSMRGKRFEQSGITEVKGKKMMISTKGRYALRVMADLAEHGPEYVSLSDVSARQAVSLKYLEAIIAALSRADFVESRRGKTGGYRLKKP